MPFKNPHPLYSIWQGMKRRCYNPNMKQFKDYGERGIFVCDRWVHSFSNFISDMPPRPEGYEINRIDNDGPYSPENCNWVSHKENMRNGRNTVYVVIHGTTYLLSGLAEESGLKPDTIIDRANKGFSFDKVMTKTRFYYAAGLALGGNASGAKKKALTHCKHGHEFTPENTRITKQGWRRCRACRRK